MNRKTSDVVLNANQRRHFEVLLSGLEQALARIDSAASPSATEHFLLTTYRDAVPPDIAATLREHAEKLRAEIERLRTDLALQARSVSRRQTIRALLTAEIIRIEESVSGQLRGYGTLDPSVGALLDPVLSEMREELAAMSRLLRDSRRSETAE